MRVSVSMVSHQHERFLRQAVESVLAQDFTDWELVIGDDASTDSTGEILRELAALHPGRIRVLPREQKLGPRVNYMRTLSACRGQYVALLDGDDWWCSPHKLSRQVALLDAHPEHALCFCAAREVSDPGDAPLGELRPPGARAVYRLPELLADNLACSCTVVFRRGLFGDFPDWYREVPVGDWPLHSLNARHGSLAYLDEVMAVHRVHARGVWGGRSPEEQTSIRRRTREFIHRHVAPELGREFREACFSDRYRLARDLERAGLFARAREQYAACWRDRASRGATPLARVVRRWLRCAVRARLRPHPDRGARAGVP